MTKQLNSVTRRSAAGAGQDAAGRQEPEILQRLVERLLPSAGSVSDGREGTRDAAPAILDREIDRRAVGGLQAVFGIPDLPRDRCDPLGSAEPTIESTFMSMVLPSWMGWSFVCGMLSRSAGEAGGAPSGREGDEGTPDRHP